MLTLPGKATGWEDDNMLMAGGKKGWPLYGGRLIYFKGSKRAVAQGPLFFGIKESLKGNRKRKKDLIDDRGIPEAEALLLYALRQEAIPLDRSLAFSLLQSSMERKGDPFSEEEIKKHSHISYNRDDFESFVGDWLVTVVIRDGSSGLRVLADWIDDFNKYLERPHSKEDQDFLTAVELATARCEGVPVQKEVKLIWEMGSKGRMRPDRFRQARDRMGFNWLPAGRRGAAAH